MVATILPKRKTTAGATVGGDLLTGEMALEDSKGSGVFKDSAGAIRLINGFRAVVNDTDTYTHTGTGTETILSSYFVPENTFVAGSVIGVETLRTKNAIASTTAINLYINTSNSLSGATLIANFDVYNAIKYQVMKRKFIVSSDGSSILGYPSSETNPFDDESAFSFSTYSYDVTADIYFILSETLSGATTDTVTQRLFSLTEMR